MNLNTAEKFLILAHHPEKGRFIVNEAQLSYGIVGALLLDLSLENIVTVQDKRLVYRGVGTVKDPIMTELSGKIRQSEKSRKIGTWIYKFARRSGRYRRAVLRQLADKRIIRIEDKKFLGLIPYKKSYIIDKSIRTELIRIARNNVLFQKDITDENVVVLGLIEACRMHKVISSDREELKRIRKDLKEIIKSSPIAAVVAETIKQVQAVMISAIIASSAASSAGH
jgi:golgi phosphoprotein 3